MSLFNQYDARPGLPYRATDEAILAALVGFLMFLFLMNLVVGQLRPSQTATFGDHLMLIIKHPSAWLQFMATYPIRAGAWYFTVLSVPAAAAVMIFIWANRLRDPYIHVRGRRLKTGKVAKRAARAASAKAISESSPGLTLTDDLRLSRRQEVQSFVTAGVQGGGKTVVINSILQGALGRNDKMIVYDLVKGDYTSIIPSSKGAQIVLLSPWDQRTHAWAIGKDLRNVSDATAFSLGLIPESDDPMWANAARGILVAGILFLIDQRGYSWGWRELADYCRLSIADQKLIVDSYYQPAASALADAESKTTQSIKINLDSFLLPIWDLARRWRGVEADAKKTFSISEWLADDNTSRRRIIIHGNAADPVLTTAFGRAVTEYTVSRIAGLGFPESDTRRIWFFLDEILQMGRLSCISRLLEIGRSKGVACVFGFQTIDQVRQIYPQHEAEKWQGLFGIKIFPRVKGTASQKWVCDEVGMREVERRNRNVSGHGNKINVTDSYQRMEIPVILPSELESLIGPRKDGVDALVLGHGNDALVLRFPWSKLRKVREGFKEVVLPSITAQPVIDAEEAARLLGIKREQVDAVVEPRSTDPDDVARAKSLVPKPAHDAHNDDPPTTIEDEEVSDDDIAGFLINTALDESDQINPDVKTESMEEVEDALLGHEIEEFVSEATGINGAMHELEAIQEITTDEPGSFQLPDEQPMKRKRKPRKYKDAEQSM